MLDILNGPEAELIKLCRQTVRASARLTERLSQLQDSIENTERKLEKVRQEVDYLSWNFKQAENAWLLVSSSGQILKSNPAAWRMLASGQEGWHGANFLDAIWPAERSACLSKLRGCSRRRQPGLWRARRRDGQCLHLQARCFGSSEPADVWLRLHRTEVGSRPWPELEDVLEGVSQGILLADGQGQIFFQNGSAIQSLGEDLRGFRLAQLGERRQRLQVVKLPDGFWLQVEGATSKLDPSARLDEIRESERLALGRDLEQSFGPTFSKMLDLTTRLAEELRDIQPERAMADQLVKLAQQCQTKSSNIQKGLFPSDLDSSGLKGALVELARTTQDCFGIRCRVFGEEVVGLERTKALHLFRIAQEALTNAVRHAAATAIELHLECDQQRVWLEVCDDGRGMESTGPQARGLGLRSMRAHAELMRGGLEVESQQGTGTRIRCWTSTVFSDPQPGLDR